MFSFPHLLSTSMCQQARFNVVLGIKPRAWAHLASTPPTELQPQRISLELGAGWNVAPVAFRSGLFLCGYHSELILGGFSASGPYLGCSEKPDWASGVRFPGGWIGRHAPLPSGTTGTSETQSLAAVAAPHPAA